MAELSTLTGGEKLKEILAKLAESVGDGATLSVGFLAGGNTYEDGKTAAEVAALNEYGHLIPVGRKGQGGPMMMVPPRPFFSNMVMKKSPTWGRLIATALKKHNYVTLASLKEVGIHLQEQLQASIVTFNDPPDKPITIKRKGFKGGAKATLQDTKQMIQSVDYRVDE